MRRLLLHHYLQGTGAGEMGRAWWPWDSLSLTRDLNH